MFRISLALMVFLGLMLQAAGGLVIDIRATPALSANAQALSAFQAAGNQWAALFDDDVIIRIDADFSSLAPGVLGEAGSAVVRTTYAAGRTAMINDGAAYADNAILGSLPIIVGFDVPLGVTVNAALLDMTRANAKALGLVIANSTVTDAVITFSSDFAFDFDPSDGITAGAFDFVAIAAHEIGHALGFVSTVDDIDEGAKSVVAATLDLFRFQNNSANDPSSAAEFATATRSLSPGVEAIFDDTQNEWLFSTGRLTGDGRQASHWKDSMAIGLMDPTLSTGELGVIREADIRAFDLIGWNRIVAIPEPSSLLLVLLGLPVFRRHRLAVLQAPLSARCTTQLDHAFRAKGPAVCLAQPTADWAMQTVGASPLKPISSAMSGLPGCRNTTQAKMRVHSSHVPDSAGNEIDQDLCGTTSRLA